MAQTTDSVADPLAMGGTDVPSSGSGIDIHSTAGKLADLKRRVAEVAHAGSERAVEKQHGRGKKTARERIDLLLDEGSFVEMDKYARHRSVAFGQEQNRPYGDGVVTGYGTVDGRTVAVFAQGMGNQAQPATKMPSAGDASSGSSGGGNTGVNTTGSTTKNSNCQMVRTNPSKYSKDIVASCK